VPNRARSLARGLDRGTLPPACGGRARAVGARIPGRRADPRPRPCRPPGSVPGASPRLAPLAPGGPAPGLRRPPGMGRTGRRPRLAARRRGRDTADRPPGPPASPRSQGAGWRGRRADPGAVRHAPQPGAPQGARRRPHAAIPCAGTPRRGAARRRHASGRERDRPVARRGRVLGSGAPRPGDSAGAHLAGPPSRDPSAGPQPGRLHQVHGPAGHQPATSERSSRSCIWRTSSPESGRSGALERRFGLASVPQRVCNGRIVHWTYGSVGFVRSTHERDEGGVQGTGRIG
jgi:hypothetical protein